MRSEISLKIAARTDINYVYLFTLFYLIKSKGHANMLKNKKT